MFVKIKANKYKNIGVILMNEKEKIDFARKYIDEKGYNEIYKVTDGGILIRLDEVDKFLSLPGNKEGIINNIENNK
ncbi:hypothetical protein MY41_14710 [Listeria monocytogenes]|nr:hypothetical protein [Listeria monocytogenes]